MFIKIKDRLINTADIVSLDLGYKDPAAESSGVLITPRVGKPLLFLGADAAALRFYFGEFMTPTLVTDLTVAYSDRDKLLEMKNEILSQQRKKN